MKGTANLIGSLSSCLLEGCIQTLKEMSNIQKANVPVYLSLEFENTFIFFISESVGKMFSVL